MNVIDVPFVKQVDDDLCALLKPNNDKFAPAAQVTDEVWKVLNLMPAVRTRIILKLKNTGELA